MMRRYRLFHLKKLLKTIVSVSLLIAFTTLFMGVTKKHKKKVPDLLIQINDTTFIDKYEISIRDYAQFLLDNMYRIDSLLPNPNNVNWYDGFWHFYEIYGITDTSIQYHVALWWKPIINISKKQAEEYCEWRTKNWQNKYEQFSRKNKGNYYKNIVFRLPDYDEWLLAASCGLDTALYPTGKSKKFRQNSFPICVEYFSQEEKETGAIIPRGASESWQFGLQNDKGIFNMCGDVAEFIRDKEFVAGGSFRDSLHACKVSSINAFNKPNNQTGFRCVAIIKP
ncbi:MAG: SUMF1/EgtB/PvdO family nonheme iron enzyme [Bacteroidales bacterium]|nr:SUMF1/EgtB/PvdO family nonheme iron enzyme [Bacteroidales bacterium]MDY0015601.1 SUMF1/EgtB/PvdO family nonheme iron enzyme [Bacteroidales bacterium]